MKRTILSAFMAVFILTVIFPINSFSQHLPPINVPIAKKSTPEVLPTRMNLATRNGIFQLEFDSATNRFERVGKFRTSGITGFSVNSIGVYAFKASKIFKLDHQLKLDKAKKFKKIEAIAANEENVFISAEGSFICLDTELNELGRVELKCGEMPKNAHDILLYQSTAYLLDNVIYPIFIFKVSIANPAVPRISGKVEFMGINPHLDLHWLDPLKSQWNIVESFNVLGGSGQVFHSFPMHSGQKATFSKTFYERNRSRKQETNGYKIYSTTDFPPVWSLVRNKKNTIQPALLKTSGNKFKIKRFTLPDTGPKDTVKSVFDSRTSDYEKLTLQKYKSSYLLVASESGKLFQILNVSRKPAVVFSQDMASLGIHRIIDIYAY